MTINRSAFITEYQIAVKNKNYKWQNINRPFLILILIAGLYYPIAKVIPMIKW